MPSSAAIRQKIESALQHRYPSALRPIRTPISEVVSTGIVEIDGLLQGGFPVGAIAELTGPLSSGRTTIAQHFISSLTKAGSVCAWIDAADTFDPESAAANGICLQNLLWVRCSNGSASAPKRAPGSSKQNSQPWTRLDQALRASDLVLQSGGFRAIVLDLANENIEHGRRIPLATWFRFRQAADRTRCSFIVLGKAPYAQSSASVVLECQSRNIDSAHMSVIQGFNFRVQSKRERFTSVASIDRKPPATTWSAQACWNTEMRA